MNNFYRDDEKFKELAFRTFRSFGKKRRAMMYELCRFRCRAADEFWSRDLKQADKIKLLPYMMMCRSDVMSDRGAEQLEQFVVDYTEYDDHQMSFSAGTGRELAGQAYCLLSACLFKESDKMLHACEKIGQRIGRIRELDIHWTSDELSDMGMPPFLEERCILEEQNGSKTDMIGFLNDILINTAANARMTDGNESEFVAALSRLADNYPEAFAPAGFYADFITDSGNAYDKYEAFRSEPLGYTVIMRTLSGLNIGQNGFEIGAPHIFIGEDNERLCLRMPVELDGRWLDFIIDKPFDDLERIKVKSPYYAASFLMKFSRIVYELTSSKDAALLARCRDYFVKSSVIGGNPADFAGLIRSGAVKDMEQLTALAVNIAKRICEGRQICCYKAMSRFFLLSSFNREQMLSALSAAEEYLVENGGAELPTVPHFLSELALMREGRSNSLEREGGR